MNTCNSQSLMTTFLSFFYLVLLLLLSYFNGGFVRGAGEAAARPHYRVVDVGSLQPNDHCSPSTSGSALGSQKLRVTYKNGPCSPNGRGKGGPYPEGILEDDEIRVQSINTRTSSMYITDGSRSKSFPPRRPSMTGGEYVVTISLGTPKSSYQMMIDTGSDITWVRCKPCLGGCSSGSSLFDISKSSTYSNGSCKSHEGDRFSAYYGDQSYCHGVWGCDTLTLDPPDLITNFQFGCGHDFSTGHKGFDGADGILGLGQGDQSLISQSASKFGKIFGYCLPKSGSDGYLYFGQEAEQKISPSELVFTPLLKDPSSGYPENSLRGSYYFLELVGMSIAGLKLNVTSSVFTSTPGTIIDSGTVITRLPKPVYSALSSAFKRSMSMYPVAPKQEILDTCFNVQGYKNIILPEIMFHFKGGGAVSLNPSGTVWISGKNKNVWCLAFAAKRDPNDYTIIGNTQQRQLEVLYDIEGGRIGFGNKMCSN